MYIKTKRPIIIAFDFDDTITLNSFPDIENAQLILEAKNLINQLYNEGYYIIIWTARYLRNHLSDCENFLNINDIKYHTINENYPYLEFKPYPKIFYDILIDDKCMIDVDYNKIKDMVYGRINKIKGL